MKLFPYRFFAPMLLLAIPACTLQAQQTTAPLGGSTASIHGYANDPLAIPIPDGTVDLTRDKSQPTKDSHFAYTFTADAQGNYKGDGIQPGTYTVVLFRKNILSDFQQNVVFTAGTDKEVNFDESRDEYIKAMSPEDRKVYEDTKKANAGANAENVQIKNLNAMLQQARDAMDPTKTTPPDYSKAVDLMTQATTARPTEPVLWFTLGGAYLGQKQYDQAASAFQKSIDLNNSSKKPAPETAGAAYNELGEALANQGKVADAAAAYESAAKVNPPQVAMYYGNEAIALYKAGTADSANQAADYAGAIVAADKTIAANPNNPIPYYVKGQSLVGQTTTDKSGKIVAPPGCIEAYQQYLALAPEGTFAPDVKAILQGFGAPLTLSYKAGKK
jgi:tetratricopeptide (TPR) repeat protein